MSKFCFTCLSTWCTCGWQEEQEQKEKDVQSVLEQVDKITKQLYGVAAVWERILVKLSVIAGLTLNY